MTQKLGWGEVAEKIPPFKTWSEPLSFFPAILFRNGCSGCCFWLEMKILVRREGSETGAIWAMNLSPTQTLLGVAADSLPLLSQPEKKVKAVLTVDKW